MDLVDYSKNLNAFKLNLVLLNVTKNAARFKLQEIVNTHPIANTSPSTSKASSLNTSVSEFLKKTYNSLIKQYPNDNDLPKYLYGLVKTLNPEYPNERPQNDPFPNDLESFDIPSCYHLASEIVKNKQRVLNINADADLDDFSELRFIRNEFYAQLSFFQIEDNSYSEQIKKLEKIVEKFIPVYVSAWWN